MVKNYISAATIYLLFLQGKPKKEQKITLFTVKLYIKQLIKFVNIILCHIKK